MEVSKEFFEQLGACPAGVDWFLSKGQDVISLSALRQILDEDREQNRITEKEYCDFRAFEDAIKYNGKVILRSNNYTLVPNFRIKVKTYSESYESYDLALLHKNSFIESEVQRFASSISVLEKSPVAGGAKVKTLPYPQTPKEGRLYEIHDSETGKYRECHGKTEFDATMSKILEKKRKLLQGIAQIEQQIIDNENGNKGWVKYNFISTSK